MRFALFLANQHPLGTDMRRALDEQLELVAVARENAWDGVLVGHHYLASDLAMLQPVPLLARIAAEAGEMSLGLGILLLPLLNPVHVAETVATLDVIAKGRFILGVGLGYRESEAAAFGITRAELAHRFEENLEAVRKLCTEPTVSIDLPWCRISDAGIPVRPAGMPPVWMAAHADTAIRRAARTADAWFVNPHASLEPVRRQLQLFRAERAAAGRPGPVAIPVMREVFCAATTEQALVTAAPYLSAKYATYASWGQDLVVPDQPSFTAAFADLLRDRFIIGSPDDCVRELRRWTDLGCDYLVIRTHWPGLPADAAANSLALLSREVLPQLRAA